MALKTISPGCGVWASPMLSSNTQFLSSSSMEFVFKLQVLSYLWCFTVLSACKTSYSSLTVFGGDMHIFYSKHSLSAWIDLLIYLALILF